MVSNLLASLAAAAAYYQGVESDASVLKVHLLGAVVAKGMNSSRDSEGCLDGIQKA